MDLMTINGTQIPYPNEFTLKKELNVVNQYKTMTGQILADYNGWRYADTTINWDCLENDDLQALMRALAPTLEITFLKPNGELETVNAILAGVNQKKLVCEYQDGGYVWKDVQIEVTFPDVF